MEMFAASDFFSAFAKTIPTATRIVAVATIEYFDQVARML